MTGIIREQMRLDLESLGWKCEEHGATDDWTVVVSKDGRSIISTGIDRQLVWNAAYREVLKLDSA
jgi:hypothetical protein